MTWSYTLLAERRMPPCPQCQSVSGVVRLTADKYACLACAPRRAFGATWVDEDMPLPVSSADLTLEAKQTLDRRLAGVGKQHRAGFERGYVEGLIEADARDRFTEWRG